MKNPNKKILISLSIACLLGLFAYLSPTLAKVINFGTGSDTSYFPGNIGVGATTTDKLNVSGTLRVTGTTTLAAYTGQGNQCLYVDNGGIVRMLGSQCGSATGGDNLGNHTATQNLNLAANALVGNGGSTGITISSGGAVSVANGLTLTSGTLSLPNNAVTDAMVSDTLTASNLVSGSAVVSDAEVDNNITVTSGTIGSNNVSSASTWTTLGTLTIGDNGDAVLMSATNWDVDSSGNIFANGGFSTYDTTVTDNYIEAGGFCMGNGTNCITSWTNAGGNVNASSPTANYVTKFSDSDTIANSQIFDNGSGVGIGTTTVSSARLVVDSASTYSIDAGGKPMINVGISADPTASVNRNYVDSAIAGISGGGGYWMTTGSAIYATSTMTSVGVGTTSPTAPFEVYGGFYMGGGSGDVDNNGYVNSIDALIAAQFAHNLTSLTPLQQAMADVDGDGMVTDFDAKNIMKRFVNIYSSRNQMNTESRRLKALGLNFDGSGQVMIGYSDYSNEVYMRDRFTVFGTSLMDTTATSTFNPSNSTSSALMLTGPYGGGLIFKDTAYGGLWMSDSGQTLNFASNGSGSGFGSTYGQMVLKNGNVGISTTNPTRPLHVVGNVQVDSGSVTADAFYYNSDRTLKKDIKPIYGALAKVLNLQGVSFKWRDSGEANYGFIAQDVEKVLPELVETGVDGKKSVAYGNFTAILVEALKTQQKEIDSLQARVKSLESSLK
ncbi:MAG: tail fiber domain-containing protein [Patescibacteria group bacterium]